MAGYGLIFNSVRENEGPMLDQIQAILDKHGIDEACRHRLLQAVSEAFTNALIHGNKLAPEKQIRLDLEINEQSVRADITDDGEGALAGIAARSHPDTWSENGRGVDLIRYYADSVEFIENASGGLTVSIVVRRLTTKTIMRMI